METIKSRGVWGVNPTCTLPRRVRSTRTPFLSISQIIAPVHAADKGFRRRKLFCNPGKITSPCTVRTCAKSSAYER